MAKHAVSNEEMRDYGARPILNRIDLIVNVLKAELRASLRNHPRAPENTKIQITSNSNENNRHLFITIEAEGKIIVEGHYDLNEGGFSKSPSN